ncbi:MAG: endo alpha-1,4 polygalactosaminidase [Actinomycetia bacterium]|nr:endo alpha-1,4 polygalactosaminidase [Actinomycetes bacterium]
MKARLKNDVVRGLLWWIPGCLVFFRAAFTSGFDKITGTDGDARLIIFLHEHWVQAAQGDVSWTSPQLFFPTKGVLGYSEGFLLNETFYLPLRAIGMDQFMAFQWTLILLSLVGFVSLFVFLRRVFNLSAPICAALATTFTFANNLYVKSIHAQLYAVHWLPLILLLVLQAFRATNPRARNAWGFAAGAVFGLLYFTSFYIAWYATFAVLWIAGLLLIWRVATRGFGAVRRAVHPYLPATLSAAGGFGLAMIPFAITYARIAKTFPDRHYLEAMAYAAWPSDMINVGASNLMWGSALRSVVTRERLYNHETSLALTPILMLAALVGCVVILIRRRTVAVGFAGELGIACGVTLVTATLLPVQFDGNSAWAVAYTFFPGARSLRAIDRIMLIGVLLAVMIIAIALASLRDRERVGRARRSPRAEAIGIAVVLALIVVEQVNVGASSLVDRSDQQQMLSAVPDPPDACQAFYITDSGPFDEALPISAIDAMLIAQRYSLPTLNGYSGQSPRGFRFLDPRGDDYLYRVGLWVREFGLSEGLCSYDRFTNVWTDQVPALPPSNAGLDYQLGGAYEPTSDTQIVARDRTDAPDPSRYNICYVNGFQTQPDEADMWLTENPDLLLRNAVGEAIVDPEWPDEHILDVSTPESRERLLEIVGAWIDGCADDGFQAVEIDNLDTFTRFPQYLTAEDAVAFAYSLAVRAHAAGLAIGQKNAAELLKRRPETTFDFAVVEQCNEYEECSLFKATYGDQMYVIEYEREAFESGCENYPELSIVLRDVNLSTPESAGYIHDEC